MAVKKRKRRGATSAKSGPVSGASPDAIVAGNSPSHGQQQGGGGSSTGSSNTGPSPDVTLASTQGVYGGDPDPSRGQVPDQGVSVVRNPDGSETILSVNGEPVRPSTAPTLAEFATNSSRYVTSSEELRAKYLGGDEGQELRSQRRLEAVIRGLPMPEGEEDYKADMIALIPSALKASASTGIPASVLLGVSGQESGYGTNLGPSTADARGETQFIPSTRDYMIDKYGVDPWAGPEQAMEAAGLYLKELGFMEDPQAALSSYSGGYAQGEYNNPILTRADVFSPIDRFVGKVNAGQNTGSTLAKGTAAQNPGLEATELFFDPGTNLVDNQPTGPIGGHGTHVHFASDNQADLLRAVAIAERMGLDVRENPLFETVDPVHTTGSEHYQESELLPRLRDRARELGGTGNVIGDAIDVQGDASGLSAYNARLAELAGAPLVSSGGSVSGGYGGLSSPGGIPSSSGSSIEASLTGGTAPATKPVRPYVPTRAPAENPLAATAALPEPYLERTTETDDDSTLTSPADIYDTLTLGNRRRLTLR